VATMFLTPAFTFCFTSGARPHAHAPQLRMQAPDERWETYKAAKAAERAFRDDCCVESALSLCRVASQQRDVDPDVVVDALTTLEKEKRAAAKADDGATARETLDGLNGAWRLVFTTGDVQTQKKLGRSINYFPLRATQSFDTSNYRITNGIYLGSFAVLKFEGTFEWIEKQRKMVFDFDRVRLAGIEFPLGEGDAAQIGASTGLGSETNLKKEGKKGNFLWISADEEIATARGGGGGLALWRRDREMQDAT